MELLAQEYVALYRRATYAQAAKALQVVLNIDDLVRRRLWYCANLREDGCEINRYSTVMSPPSIATRSTGCATGYSPHSLAQAEQVGLMLETLLFVNERPRPQLSFARGARPATLRP